MSYLKNKYIVIASILLVIIVGIIIYRAIDNLKVFKIYNDTSDEVVEASSSNNTYTIVYKGKGATSGSVSSHTCKKNSKCTIKSNGFKRTGYSFAGWTTNSDGKNDGYGWTGWSGKWTFTNGQKGIKNNKLVLYAKWKKNNYVITSDSKYNKFPTKVSCDSSTLKYRIISYNNQYVALIWVKDPSIQLNNALGSSNGKGTATAETMLNKEIKNYNYNKKCLVAVNSSFFEKGEAWGGVTIHKGKIVRNTGLSSGTTIGINKNGTLTHYGKKSAKELLNNGFRNTFVASSLASKDSTRLLSNRTQICQYDKNNFIIYSGYGTVKDPAKQITNLTGCKNVYNLDGGGSRKLYYQTKSSGLKRLYGGDRKIPEMLYFVEQ